MNASNAIILDIHQGTLFGYFSAFDIGTNKTYINEGLTRKHLESGVSDSIIDKLQELMKKYKGNLHLNMSISGTTLELLRDNFPKAIKFIKQNADNITFLATPYFRSHPNSVSLDELNEQIELQKNLIMELFNKETVGVFYGFENESNLDKTTKIISSKEDMALLESELANGKKFTELNQSILNNDANFTDLDVGRTMILNPIQEDAITSVASMEEKVKSLNNSALLNEWRALTSITSLSQMDLTKEINSHDNAYEAFSSFRFILEDINAKIDSLKSLITVSNTN